MKEFELKYGCNPNQKPARIYMEDGSDLPVEILNSRPGYINFLDAFNSWQLVRELKEATGLPAAASFKHVSPTSAAVGTTLSEKLKKACFVDDIEDLESSPLACAYARARGCDRMCSFGDWAALSDVCDKKTAELLRREVSDGIIAPGYEPEALEILKSKRGGAYNIVKIDPDYTPAPIEKKQVFGITFEQGRNNFKIDEHLLENIVTENKNLPEAAARDLVISLGRWFRDYMYIPLGGSARGLPRQLFALAAVWLFAALFHGATLCFLLWGLYCFALTALEKFVLPKTFSIGRLGTFLLVSLGWIFFFSPSVRFAASFAQRLFCGGGTLLYCRADLYDLYRLLPFFLLCSVLATPLVRNAGERLWRKHVRLPLYFLCAAAYILALSCMAAGGGAPFWYAAF